MYLYTGATFRALSVAVISRVTFPSGRKFPLQLLSHMTILVESDVFNIHVESAFSLNVQEIEALSYDFSQYGVLVNLSSGGFTSPIGKDRITYINIIIISPNAIFQYQKFYSKSKMLIF